MNVRTKLRGAFAVYIALLAGLSLYHVRATRRAVASGRDLADIALRLRATSAVQPGRLVQVNTDAQKYLVTRDTGYLAKVQRMMHDYEVELRHLASLNLSAKEREFLAPLTAEWNAATALADQLAEVPRESADSFRPKLEESIARVQTGTQALASASQDAMDRELALSEQSERAAERVTLVAAGGAVLLSLLLSALLARSILDPLVRLTEGTREVSAGRFGHRLTARGNDELAQVAREFNAMTERLHELDRMKGEFVSKVSHDLKTPLSSMQETNGVLLEELPGPLTPKQRQLLEINQESAQRLSTMLGKLLDLSRIEAVEAKQQSVDVRPLVQRSVERLTKGSLGDRLVLSIGEPAQRLLVRGDPEGLIQVFDNLLENAIKFSPFDGRVHVRVADLVSRGDVPPECWASLRRHAAVGAVLVTVSDEGPGITDEEKERVFARFYQTEAGRGVRARGVGLGLAICKEIVLEHGGAIWVSDNEPRGSVFSVLLPGAVRVGAASSAPTSVLAGRTARRA